jgi:hypothetical protein
LLGFSKLSSTYLKLASTCSSEPIKVTNKYEPMPIFNRDCADCGKIGLISQSFLRFQHSSYSFSCTNAY